MMSPKLTRRELLAASAAVVAASFSLGALPSDESIVPFQYRASDNSLDDLKRRLNQTRWPERETSSGWEQGVPLDALQRLVKHWRTVYDWRRCEVALARWPQFRTRVDDLGIHFIHVRSRHENALPIILTHGWPSTIMLFSDVIGPLVDPTAHGGSSNDAFHVVIPSLPGFGFSDKPTRFGA
jgi:epoxide hydrolase